MPIVNGRYVNPGWVNDAPPAIDADELNAMSDSIVNSLTRFPQVAGNFDFNTITEGGIHERQGISQNSPYSSGSNQHFWIHVYNHLQVSGYTRQMAYDVRTTASFKRACLNGTWTNWETILSSSSIVPGWKLLWSQETAGGGSWIAPDVNNGKPYKIGFLIIGGGASGIATYGQRAGDVLVGIGGPSGCSLSATAIVTPGVAYPYVVGAGGAKYNATPTGGTTWTSGNNAGGSSSLFGKSVLGGGFATSSLQFDIGGQLPIRVYGNTMVTGLNPYGGVAVPVTINNVQYMVNKNPLQCYNPFENIPILGCGGGGCTIRDSGTIYLGNNGISPLTGLGGGVGAASYNNPAYGEDATEPGCGGGGAAVGSNTGAKTVISGAGKDGAIKIYVMGVAT